MHLHTRSRAIAILIAACGATVTATQAQVRVNPTGVSTNAMAPTTVFLTFGGLRNQVPAEGLWCGEVVPAVLPERGTRCDPQTVYGRLPLRSDLSRLTVNGAFTDIMSIPASVTRRAYFAAFRGQSSTFFYVRRFTSTIGGADEFVAVTCRLTGGGAGVPFALTDVAITFDGKNPVQFVRTGDTPPAISAAIQYNGSGQLRGRWEVVMPGEEAPSVDDLLTEATLPPEERGQQRRYALLERFNVTVLPGGRVVLPGPDPSRLPHAVDGSYLVLLRIEATDDGAGDSNRDAVGAGGGLLHNGAVAGFPMPTLRYIVGSADNRQALTADEASVERVFVPMLPRENADVPRDSLLTARWTPLRGASFYRIEFIADDGHTLLSAIVKGGQTSYDAPPLLAQSAATATVRWRVTALDGLGAPLRRTVWHPFRFLGASPPP
jgi:hypothetical protein